MVDHRTNLAKEISQAVKEAYGEKLKIFQTEIPRSVRAAKTSEEGIGIYSYDSKGKAAQAYKDLTKEVLSGERLREKHKADFCR